MGGIEFLNPKGLFVLAGLVPLIAFYILKVKRTRVKVGSTWLWSSARRDLLAKSPFKRLVAELPLVLQILALVALAIAFARPTLRGNTIAGDHIAIVIDTSASMGALTGGTQRDGTKATRFSEAQKAAESVVAQLAPGAEAFVLEAGHEARMVTQAERDARELVAAVRSLHVREVEGDLAGAVALAADRLRSLSGRRRIVVITDGALAKEGGIGASGVDVELVTVGTDVENAALVRVDVRSGIDPATKHEQVQVFVMVRNYADKPRDAFVTLSLEGRTEPVASRRIVVAPNDKAPIVLTFEPKASDYGQGLIVQLSPSDALASDDIAYARVPLGRKMPVTIASASTNSWLARALDADPNVDLQKLNLEQLATVNIDPEALLVVDGACPGTSAGSLPGRDVLIAGIPAGRACQGIDVGAETQDPPITRWEVADPRFRFLTLDGVHIAHAVDLKAEGAGAALVHSTNSILMADASVPGRSITIVGFDVGETDWPLRASFVLFVRNVVELARLHRSQGVAGPARTGDTLRVAVPTGTETLTASGPDMPEREISAKLGFAILPPIDRAGLYRVRWTAPHIGGALIAANLTSERESDVRPKTVSVDGGGGTVTTAAKINDRHSEWTAWLALLAALVIAFDVWWITRTPKAPRVKSVGAPTVTTAKAGEA